MSLSTTMPLNALVNARTASAPSAGFEVELDAMASLRADHEALYCLSRSCQLASSLAQKQVLLAQVVSAFAVHVQVDEEIFYADVKAEWSAHWPSFSAGAGHNSARQLMRQLVQAPGNSVSFDAKVTRLCDLVRQHIQEANDEVFPMAQASSLNLVDIGARMAARKADLLTRRGHEHV